jgi:drug/metabolite transporter (DMT)-like permease
VATPFPFAGELCALSSSLLWAVSGVIFARVRPGVSAGAMNLGKNLTAAGCFLLVVWLVAGRPWPAGARTEGLVCLLLSGFVGLTLCDWLLFRAILTIGPRRSTLLMALAPPLTALVALLPPFSERPPLATWAGIAVCLAGLVLAVLERSPDALRQAVLRRGARDALLAALLQALGLLLARRGLAVGGVTTAEGAYLRLLAGAGGLVVLGAAVGRLRGWLGQLHGGLAWRQIAVAALLGTFLGIWLNQAGLAWSRHTGVAATLNSLAPVFLIPLSSMFLAERHDARAWVSTVLAVGGVALMTVA